MTALEAEFFLSSIGQQQDAVIDIVEAAFAFGLSDQHDADIQKYRDHFSSLSHLLSRNFETLSASNNSDDSLVKVQALKKTLMDDHGYLGDDVNYNDLRNINLLQVIDRRLGIPITLSILAIGLCRAMGWKAYGVNFPGHFIMRLDGGDGERIVVDPFQNCKILEAKDMRIILKQMMGEEAELSADFYEPCSNRDILLRLQNNIKYRMIDAEDYQGALRVVMQMALIAPDDYRLNLDMAVLFSRLDQTMAAIENIQTYLDHVTDPHDKAEAIDFLTQLKTQLN